MFKKILLSTAISFIAVSSVQAMEDNNTESRSYSPSKITIESMVNDILPSEASAVRNLQWALETYKPEALEALHTYSPACFQNEMSAEGRGWIVTSLAICNPEQIGAIASRLPQISSLLPKDKDQDEDRVDYTLISALAKLRVDQINATLENDNVSRLLPQGMDAKELVASLIPLSADKIRAKASKNSNQN